MTGNLPANPDDSGEFLLYQTEDGRTKVEVRFAETIWLSQRQIAELFQITVPKWVTKSILTLRGVARSVLRERPPWLVLHVVIIGRCNS